MPAKPLARKAKPRKAAGKAAPGKRPAGIRTSTAGRARAGGGGAKGAPRRAPGKPKTSGEREGPEAVQAYFRRFPPQRRVAMVKLWAAVQEALPGSSCVVSYGIAIASVAGRRIAGVGSGQAHVGLYLMDPPFVRAHAALLEGLDVSGGTVRFPLDKPLPAARVRRIVHARLASLGRRYGADEGRARLPRLVEKAPRQARADIESFAGRPMVVPLEPRDDL